MWQAYSMAAAGKIPPVMEKIRKASEKLGEGERGAQAAFAKDLEVSRNTVSMWFRGLVTPDPEYWPAIEKYLRMRHGTLAMIAADHYDPEYRKLRMKAARAVRAEAAPPVTATRADGSQESP